MKYIVITKEQAQAVADGTDLELSFGKKLTRMLTTKSDLERKREILEAKYAEELAKLDPQPLVQRGPTESNPVDLADDSADTTFVDAPEQPIASLGVV